MTQIQETEYKTVEEKVTRFKCDSCGHVTEADDMRELQVRGVNPPKGIFHQCDECSEMDQPVSLREALGMEVASAKLDKFVSKIGFALALSFFFLPGLAAVSRFLVTQAFIDSFAWMVAAYVVNAVLVFVTFVILEEGFNIDMQA